MEKLNIYKVAVFCSSEEEKKAAIEYFKLNTTNFYVYADPITWKTNSYVLINGKTIDAFTKKEIPSLKEKNIINFKDLKIKIYKPKWKGVWKD